MGSNYISTLGLKIMLVKGTPEILALYMAVMWAYGTEITWLLNEKSHELLFLHGLTNQILSWLGRCYEHWSWSDLGHVYIYSGRLLMYLIFMNPHAWALYVVSTGPTTAVYQCLVILCHLIETISVHYIISIKPHQHWNCHWLEIVVHCNLTVFCSWDFDWQ